jgi:hypothetical protein
MSGTNPISASLGRLALGLSPLSRLACGLRKGGHWYTGGRCAFCGDPQETAKTPVQNEHSRARNAEPTRVGDEVTGDDNRTVRIRYGFIGRPTVGWARLPLSVIRKAAGDEGAEEAILDVLEGDQRHAVLYLKREHGMKAVPIDGRLAILGVPERKRARSVPKLKATR